MNNFKQFLGIVFLGVTSFIASAQATDNIYKIDTNGAEDSPKSLVDIYGQDGTNVAPETTVNYLSLKPSGTVWGLLGKQALAIGQGMLPFGGNGIDSTFYGVAEAEVGMKRATGYYAGFGGGYRKIFDNSYIVGGYLLADWNRSPLSHNFWVGNLGVEVLNYNWDIRVNAYIPVGKKYWLGDTQTGVYEETATGFDAEVGRILPIPKTQGLKLFVGGYRFDMNKTHNVAGVEARIVYPVTRYLTLEARDSYDSVRFNIGMVGLRFTLGGYNNENKDNLGIAGRMSDAIEHNFANFASCNTVVINKKYPSVPAVMPT